MSADVGDYVLKERLNPLGGQTEVYRAEHSVTGEVAVLKCPKANLGPDEATRALAEYAILQDLAQPGIVKATACLETARGPVIVLEHIVGGTLRSEIERKGKLPLNDFFRVAISLSELLQAVHTARVIHLDVNPSNVMLEADNKRAQLIDFGLSTRVRREHRFTFNPGRLIGTLPYLAPEQTGRTNRSVDYRSDLYALGCTLYEMLTGQPPFSGRDPLQLVHQHIAKIPTRADELRADAPPTLGRIIARLLAKNAEDRYQSALGLALDLRRCQEAWRADITSDFQLATEDVSALFSIPEVLLGREGEVDRLLHAFGSIPEDRPGLMLVSGYSGVGKSRLIREVQRPLAERAGYFVSGKFDQYQRRVPFAALRQALRDLVGQVLIEPEDQVAVWRERVIEAVGANGALMIESLPELVHLIGEQPPVPELPPREANNRQANTLRQFMQAVCTPERPVAMFLDDLQWVDGATLTWLEQVVANEGLAGLFLIGAYRSNEVDPGHPLVEAVDRLERSGVHIGRIELQALSSDHVHQLVAKTLHRPVEEVDILAQVVHKRTGGNPFFVTQLLESLHEDGAIRFDNAERRWSWDTSAASKADASPNVVDLMVERLSRLPQRAREVLYVAACLGNRFRSDMLTAAAEMSETDVLRAMEDARSGGFTVRVRALDGGHVEYGFLHDRVQQAAFGLVDDSDGKIRSRIGWLMVDLAKGDSSVLFRALENLNPTRETSSDPVRLAGLNLLAAQEARSSAAFEPALQHIRISMELSGSVDFEQAYERAWCEHLTGDDAGAEQFFDEALTLADTDHEYARIHIARVHFYTDTARFEEAYAAGRAGAAHFGHQMPASFVPPALILDFLKVKFRLRGTDVGTLVDHREMSDPRLVIGARIAAAALKAAYQIRPELCVANAAKLVNSCLNHGNFDDSPVAYLVLGSIFQGGVMGNHAAGFDWGNLAIDLIDKYDNAHQRAEVLFVYSYFAHSWTKPLWSTESFFRKAWRAGQETGDVFHASCACSGITQGMLMRGATLEEVEAECDRFLPLLVSAQSHENAGTVTAVRQAARALQGKTENPDDFGDARFDEAKFRASLEDYGSRHFAHFYFVDKLAAAALAENWDLAEQTAAESSAYLEDSVGMQHGVEHHFYAALVAAQRGRARPVRKQAKAFAAWAGRCPENFRHKQLILDAEVARLGGKTLRALELYDQAADDANRNGFRQHEGLAMLRAARLHEARGEARAAQRCASETVRAWTGWGATALVEPLLVDFPMLSGASALPLISITTTGSGTKGTTTGGTSALLDMTTVLKSGQALAGHVQLEHLLAEMLDIVIEGAGAQRAALLLRDSTGWTIQGERDQLTGELKLMHGAPWRDHPGVAGSVIQYSLRSKSAVVVPDLKADDRFRNDPRAAHAVAVLCMPLVHQGEISGVLYLENNLLVGGFTGDRITMLELLGGQMAVSIENADLYERLEHKVQERTQQLNQRNQLIRQTFGRYLSDQVVDTLLESPQGLELGGERQEVTIMMSDLRGFVSMSERLTPEQVVFMLNNYLSTMTEIIFSHRGTINEFIGDAILVVFGAPFKREDDAERAVRCALEMQRAMDEVNTWNEEHGLPRVQMGIGLHTGDVVVGNIGSEKRMKYGVVGQTVNLASRVESYTVGGQVLASESTASRVADLSVGGQLEVEPKGVSTPIRILEIIGIGGEDAVTLDPDEPALMPLANPVEVQYRALSGKDVVAEAQTGRIIALAEHQALLEGESNEPPLTNLRIEFETPSGEMIDTIYAKIPMQASATTGPMLIRFTAIPQEARDALKAWLPKSADSGPDGS